MAYLFKWLLSYGQRFQLIQSQSDQSALPQPQIPQSSQLLSKLQSLLKHFKYLLKNFAKKIDSLQSNTKEKLILIGIALMAFLLYRLLKKDPQNPSPPSNNKSAKVGAKRTSSLLSMKQYESHSNSDNSEIQQQLNIKTNKKGSEIPKKMAKQFRQFYTDVETEHNNTFEVLDNKRDKFFFTLVGSYQKTSQKQKQIGEDAKQIYHVQYKKYDISEGESLSERSSEQDRTANRREKEQDREQGKDRERRKTKQKTKNKNL